MFTGLAPSITVNNLWRKKKLRGKLFLDGVSLLWVVKVVNTWDDMTGEPLRLLWRGDSRWASWGLWVMKRRTDTFQVNTRTSWGILQSVCISLSLHPLMAHVQAMLMSASVLRWIVIFQLDIIYHQERQSSLYPRTYIEHKDVHCIICLWKQVTVSAVYGTWSC